MADDNDHPPPRSQADKEKSRQQSRAVSAKPVARPGANRSARGARRAPDTRNAPDRAATKKGAAPSTNGAKAPSPARSGSVPRAPDGKSKGTGLSTSNRRVAATAGSRATGRPPNSRRAATTRRPGKRSSSFLLTWGTVALVILIVVILVVVKVTSSNNAGAGQNPKAFTPLPASIASTLASVPSTVFDKVGVTSPAATVTPPTVVSDLPALASGGKATVFYVGGEFCPFCAAERWALAVALSRFGTLSGLGEMQSSSTDSFPDTQTLTFYKTSLNSPYVDFQPVEEYSSVPDAATGSYTTLQRPTAAQNKIINTYYQPKYLPGVTAGKVGIPFVDFGNKAFVLSASFSPAILQNLSRQDIATGLKDPTNPVTQTIITTANYMTAAICAADGGQPSAVCTSKGVTAAAKALKLSS